jgi:uncharacterized protein YggE
MRRALAALILLALAGPAGAQTALAVQPASPYDKAPWWMREAIIASTGYVRTEIPANRASFNAAFQAVERNAPDAAKAAVAKVQALGDTLRAYGADKVRVETTLATRPLYDQYKDKDGNLVDNERPDKIVRYQVTANVTLEIRDVSLVEKVYAAVLAASPTSASPVYFSLKPDNETNTELFKLAIVDANRRAHLAAEAAGAKVGPIKLIDPTGRACETDVLVAGAPRSYGDKDIEAQEVVVTGARKMAMAPPPAPAAPMQPHMAPEPIQLPLQPPLHELTASACVVYGLAG